MSGNFQWRGCSLDNKISKRNFYVFLVGQGISYTGTWLQNVAMAWIVLEITGSPFWVGLVAGLPLFTSASLVCVGGMIADKFDKRKILYFTQISQMAQAFALILVVKNQDALPIIVILSFLLGVANALDKPTRTALIPELVGRNRTKSVMAWSGSLNDIAKITGPTLAGLLSTVVSIEWLFFINGLTFMAVISILPLLKTKGNGRKLNGKSVHLFLAGVKYAMAGKERRSYLLLAGLIALSNLTYRVILPIVAVDLFRAGSGTVAFLFTLFGIGALGGTILVLLTPLNPYLMALGCLCAGVSFSLLPFVTDISYGAVLVSLAGVGFTASYLTSKILIQNATGKRMMGRVLGLMFAFSNGGGALGQLALGGLAGSFGCGTALWTNSILLITLAGFAYLATRKK